MEKLEPFRLIVQKEEHAIEKRMKILLQLNEQNKPSIVEKESEFQIVDAEYQKIHDQQ